MLHPYEVTLFRRDIIFLEKVKAKATAHDPSCPYITMINDQIYLLKEAIKKLHESQYRYLKNI
ncbi:hypothetical protein AJ85_10500 [Alkalihalobacillus alcalophilus ATCC 27647 = CGMCC 1.3604]|uniref:Uncharacterized protein n=1 Tax=Alkalihalobacillus alcalophilus ATCC 27647 = CGMCC 1.3604 TaxID=1218173 RepID=A0A094WNK0_ALKAL|nr:hypothetical protein BALCAV_0204960 [Alkalihalobacillus alcalophilus ATCC 27647 = CGMCC 1.3604]THG90481.1 hypothetical protein AJ85_10500 [Alkalihalobacillus alcalophilus ATCC 27647 = CGMCC 1.3604]